MPQLLYFFRSPSTHRMSPWVKKVFIHMMPKILFMQRPHYMPRYSRVLQAWHWHGVTNLYTQVLSGAPWRNDNRRRQDIGGEQHVSRDKARRHDGGLISPRCPHSLDRRFRPNGHLCSTKFDEGKRGEVQTEMFFQYLEGLPIQSSRTTQLRTTALATVTITRTWLRSVLRTVLCRQSRRSWSRCSIRSTESRNNSNSSNNSKRRNSRRSPWVKLRALSRASSS